MRRLGLLLTVAVTCVLQGSHGADADSFLRMWPACLDPSAVRPAMVAKTDNDMEEMASLPCLWQTPSQLRLRVIGCEPSALDLIPREFPNPVGRNPSLPDWVCEIHVLWPGVWRGTLYTHYMNIGPLD